MLPTCRHLWLTTRCSKVATPAYSFCPPSGLFFFFFHFPFFSPHRPSTFLIVMCAHLRRQWGALKWPCHGLASAHSHFRPILKFDTEAQFLDPFLRNIYNNNPVFLCLFFLFSYHKLLPLTWKMLNCRLWWSYFRDYSSITKWYFFFFFYFTLRLNAAEQSHIFGWTTKK